MMRPEVLSQLSAFECDELEKQEQIARAAKHWLSERGYHISWDGECYVVNETGFSRDGDKPTAFKYRRRVDAYLKALELASK